MKQLDNSSVIKLRVITKSMKAGDYSLYNYYQL